MAAHLGERFKIWREQRVHQKWSLARRKRIVLGAFVLFAACCLFFVHPQRTSTRGKLAPAIAVPMSDSGRGQGAGGSGGSEMHPLVPTVPAFCNPFDLNCITSGIASSIASSLLQALQPITDAIVTNPADFLYQTPLLQDTTSPQNKVILTMNTLFVDVVDAALGGLLIIGAYNAIWGRHLNLFHSSLMELFPRAILVVAAVHFNIFFLGLFLSFENNLSLAIIHAFGYATATNFFGGLFTLPPLTGLLYWILGLVLLVMGLLLFLQMIVRIALVALCLALAPLGLGCLLLSQTMSYGRLWFSTLSSAVMVQIFQITALGLGGIFITALATITPVRIDQGLLTLFLAIGMLGLVLKIPGMLQPWVLRPMMVSSRGNGREGGGDDAGPGMGDMSGGSGGGGGSGGFGGGSTSGWESGGGGGAMMEGQMVSGAEGATMLLF